MKADPELMADFIETVRRVHDLQDHVRERMEADDDPEDADVPVVELVSGEAWGSYYVRERDGIMVWRKGPVTSDGEPVHNLYRGLPEPVQQDGAA